MSGETIANAIFLITAVICAAILVAAIYPTIYTMAGTFGYFSTYSSIRISVPISP